MKYILLISILFLCSFSTPYEDEAIIRNILSQQADAWNAGDIEGYMQAGYWQSDSLVFIGSRGPTYGYTATLNNYKKSYPTAEKMGKLTFSDMLIKRIDQHHFFVIGGWSLTRKDGDLEGYFTLLFKNINGTWKIVADHSS